MEKKRIMIIDDEEDFLKITKLNLEETNKYEVMTLSNAKDVIPQIHNFRPDIILLDILMPQMGGIEACAMLNEDPLGRTVPVIILSALDKDKDKLKAYKMGIVDYQVKPIEKDELMSKIEKALKYK